MIDESQILEKFQKNGKGHIYWTYKCKCGNIATRRATEFRQNKVKGCKECRLPDMVNMKFGRWTVIKFVGRIKYGPNSKHKWLCLCECGTQKEITGEVLKRGDSSSCGCYKNEQVSKSKLENLVGKRFGAWLVICRAENGGHHTMWRCKCECGNTSNVFADNLKCGESTSCGACIILSTKKIKKIMSIRRVETDSQRYKDWRKQVYIRDKWRCVCCDKNKVRLNSHHLNGWSWATSQRYLVNNGVTLCANANGCHQKFHQMYGKGKNTKEEFAVFLFDFFGKSLTKILGTDGPYDKHDLNRMIRDEHSNE